MSTEGYDYNAMAQNALRRIMVDVLADTAENGLPGAHHFAITFLTQAPGVDAPDWLIEKFPQAMQIMLQHEFWNLAVTPERFSVQLSFNDQLETLVVPFRAVICFEDPSESFRLDLPPDAAMLEAPEEAPAQESQSAPQEPEDAADESAQVLSLDAFRKK